MVPRVYSLLQGGTPATARRIPDRLYEASPCEFVTGGRDFRCLVTLREGQQNGHLGGFQADTEEPPAGSGNASADAGSTVRPCSLMSGTNGLAVRQLPG
jgi:hypothetical protein